MVRFFLILKSESDLSFFNRVLKNLPCEIVGQSKPSSFKKKAFLEAKPHILIMDEKSEVKSEIQKIKTSYPQLKLILIRNHKFKDTEVEKDSLADGFISRPLTSFNIMSGVSTVANENAGKIQVIGRKSRAQGGGQKGGGNDLESKRKQVLDVRQLKHMIESQGSNPHLNEERANEIQIFVQKLYSLESEKK